MVIQVLKEFLTNIIPARAINNIYIAYSGGIDSHVLLHALTQLRQDFPKLKLNPVHVNHGLFSESNTWAQHCKKICNTLNLKLKIIDVDVDCFAGASIDEEARVARYRVFTELLQEQIYAALQKKCTSSDATDNIMHGLKTVFSTEDIIKIFSGDIHEQ